MSVNATSLGEDSDDAIDRNANSGDASIENAVADGTIPASESKLALRLAAGNIVDDLDQAYLLYCEYARMVGFSVKRGSQSYFQRTEVIRMKMYYCSCEGVSDNRASENRVASYKKQQRRTQCKARLRIVRRQTEGPYTVSVFVTEHNHELLGPDASYLLRSSRNLSLAKANILDTFNSAGIGVSKTCRFIEQEVGGRQNMGYIRKDAYDHRGKKRKASKLANADADALLRYFQEKSANEPYFFWRVLLDDEGRLMNLFFRDSRCADDYAMFGDVMSVDTTFKTNKYNLMCTPFVGMNHHRQTILFGMGLLSDETTESFEWLFTVFLQSMKGKQPDVVFTDQDKAMMNAVDFAFKEAAHRLCQWHIKKNTTLHFGKLNMVRNFKEMWFKCMNECDDEEEFEQTWNTMVDMYELRSNQWFCSMYEIRRRWADCFTFNRFTAGLRATSRSEVTNKVLKEYCEGSTSLTDFVAYYEGVIADWRTNEREEDAHCRGDPGQFIYGNRLLRQGAKLYTRNVYKIFEFEAAMSMNVDVISSMTNTTTRNMEFVVYTSNSKRTSKVIYNQLGDDVSCSCAMLKTHGMFCRHIMKVFYTLNVPNLPHRYILKRWTRDAKNRLKTPCTTESAQEKTKGGMSFLNNLVRVAYDMGLDWMEDDKGRDSVMEMIYQLREELRAGKNPKKAPEKIKMKSTETNRERFLNPPEPKHRWLPPKRNSSLYAGMRRNNYQQRNSGGRMSRGVSNASTSVNHIEVSSTTPSERNMHAREGLNARQYNATQMSTPSQSESATF